MIFTLNMTGVSAPIWYPKKWSGSWTIKHAGPKNSVLWTPVSGALKCTNRQTLLTMSLTLSLPVEYATALGGVATGNIKEHCTATVDANIRYNGFLLVSSAC